MSMYKKLNNRKWLYQKYVVEKLSTIIITKLAGAKTPNSARQALIKQGIPLRSISDGLTCNRGDDTFRLNLEVINGCLLGDGFLRKYNKKSDVSYPYFAKRNIYQDHVSYVSGLLFAQNCQNRIRRCKERDMLGNLAIVFSLRSYVHKELLPLYKRWYPEQNNYKKVIPKDLSVTPTVLLHWFLDDGNSYIRKDRPTKQVCIVFCSESFTKDEQELLAAKIWRKFGVKCSVRKTQCGTGWRTFIHQKYADLFYEVIEKPVVDSLAYKWK